MGVICTVCWQWPIQLAIQYWLGLACFQCSTDVDVDLDRGSGAELDHIEGEPLQLHAGAIAHSYFYYKVGLYITQWLTYRRLQRLNQHHLSARPINPLTTTPTSPPAMATAGIHTVQVA